MASENKSKTKKTIESISDRIKASKFKFKDFVVPLAVALILLLLGIFVFVPMVRTAISFRGEYREVNEKIEKLEALEEQLRAINDEEEQFRLDLINAKEVVPPSLRVSTFMSYIENLAREKNLYASSLRAGDVQRTAVTEGDRRTYYGVSSPLSYEGSLDNILSFLDSLYGASPYIISIQNVAFRSAGDDWRVTLSVVGYYVPDTEVEVDPYAPFESYTKHQEIVEIFQEKADQL